MNADLTICLHKSRTDNMDLDAITRDFISTNSQRINKPCPPK